MNQLVTADDSAKLEGIALPYNAYVIHEDHLGGKTIASGEADIQGIVVRGHRLLHGASRQAREALNEAAKHDYRHVVDVDGIKEDMNRASSGLAHTIDDFETP